MNTPEPHSTERVLAAATATALIVAEREEAEACERVRVASMAPLDRALMRPNARPNNSPPTLFDALDPITIPPQYADPGQVTSLEHYAEVDGFACSMAVDALKSLRDVATKMVAARDAIKSDLSLTEAAQVLEMAELHTKLAPVATRKLDAAMAQLNSAIAHEQAELGKAMPSSASPMAQEIRSYARSLSTEDRVRFINTAINSKDEQAVSAVLGGPGYLSGLHPDMVAPLLAKWQTVRSPVSHKRIALLQAALAKVEHAGSQFIGNIDNYIGAQHHTVARLRSHKDKVKTVIGGLIPS